MTATRPKHETGNMIKGNLTLLSTLALSSLVCAADFTAIYQLAKESDSTYAEARAEFEAAQEKIPQGRAGLLPTVTLSGNTTYNREGVDNRTRRTQNDWNYNSHGYTLSLTQPLFRWQNWMCYDQSKRVVAQTEAGMANGWQEPILRTAQAYFDVLQAYKNLAAAQACQSAVAGQLDIAKKALQIGTGIQTDVYDAETRYESASSQVIAAETEREVIRRASETIVGSLPPALSGLRKGVTLQPPKPAEIFQWVAAAEQNNLGVQQQRLAVEVAFREVERQRRLSRYFFKYIHWRG
jgi:outer membrane protein